jgi:TPR repeat protein
MLCKIPRPVFLTVRVTLFVCLVLLGNTQNGIAEQRGRPSPAEIPVTVEEIRRMAAQGSAFAQDHLGGMYEFGLRVPQDYIEAVKWYRRAAEQGYPSAQSSLGFNYIIGQGAPRNFLQAHKWLNLAGSRFTEADKEARDLAVKARDEIARRMTPAQVIEAQTLAREWKPSSEMRIDPNELKRSMELIEKYMR